MIYFPSSIDSLGTELAFYSRAVKGRFQILIQQRSRKKKLGVGTRSSTKWSGYEIHYIIMFSQ